MHPIVLRGARTHNLTGVDLELLPGELVVIAGVSGAGKSSLAFDTLYSEGQRRFVESFSPYARQFLERLERPPMDSLNPIAAAVAVDRRAPVKSSRSTVATMADVEAYLSALFTHVAVPRCPECGVLATQRDPAAVAAEAVATHEGLRAVVTYAQAVESPEHYLDVREALLADGYHRLLVGHEARDLDTLRPSDVRGGSVDVVVDRVQLTKRGRRRVGSAIEEAWRRAQGTATLHVQAEAGRVTLHAARGLACPVCARAFRPPSPGLFSYQSPVGSCPTCRGFGRVVGLDLDKVVPDDSLSLKRKAIRPWKTGKTSRLRAALRRFCEREDIPFETPWGQLTDAQRQLVIDGEGSARGGKYLGIRGWFRWLETKQYKMHVRVLMSRFRSYDTCPDCEGKRLSVESLLYRVADLDLGDWHALELGSARGQLVELGALAGQAEIARQELLARLGYLEQVGLGYLTLSRQARTLSGGEAQRVGLTAALGTSLSGALFVIDEPSVGLHVDDLAPLIDAMRKLADRGNTVLVVEHDASILAVADRVIELGPGAGPEGGRIVFDGTPAAFLERSAGLRNAPAARRKRSRDAAEATIVGARANNLREVTVALPLQRVVGICGKSGSGKSTLVNDVLYRTLARRQKPGSVDRPGAHDRIEGCAGITQVVLVDQAPLGRTSRGNAATYTDAWTRFRTLLAATPEAQAASLTASHFSFNVAIGRCDACDGEGSETVEMQFLADVSFACPVCQGRRFRPEVLAVRLDGLDVAQLLALSIDEALQRFGHERAIVRALRPLEQLGLGYLGLGQPLSTLSGGEAQRLKLARALRKVTEGTMLIVDEPSAGLHRKEIAALNEALHEASLTASVVVVDHDLGVLNAADHLIELGPGAGRDGGQVVAEGTPSQLARRATPTGRALKRWRARKAPSRGKGPAAAEARGCGTKPPREHLEEGVASAGTIDVVGAREHNLANVNVSIERGKLVVVTGPSGSGKSSLAFDVVFAEGQRRFLETLTPYARQFLPMLPRPDADSVSGVPPSVALEQRTTRAGASSTVATVTEIAHYMRLLFAKLGVAHCPECDVPLSRRSADAIFEAVRAMPSKVMVFAPVVQERKGSYVEVFVAAERMGIAEAIVDGALVAVTPPPKLSKRKEHTIELLMFDGNAAELSRATLEQTLSLGKGQLLVADESEHHPRLYSTTRTCHTCDLSVPELDPRWFSFNTKQGRCDACDGTGLEVTFEEDVPDPCEACLGSRLAPIPRAVRLLGKRYHELMAQSVMQMVAWAGQLRFEGLAARIGEAPAAELRRRVEFVERVGLGYLALSRRATTLSGGEMQRLRLAAQLGSGLTGALYVLDEPTVGLHPRDTHRLLENLRALVDTGSTVLVVEHDADTIRAADQLIDLGPAGGAQGGQIMAVGPPGYVLAHEDSPTAAALAQEHELSQTRKKRSVDGTAPIVLRGVSAHNLRISELLIPSQRMVVVAGVSGSGKSTLVRHVLHAAICRALGRVGPCPGAHQQLVVPSTIERVALVDQAPIGRTSRSVPATFLGLWDHIRRLFSGIPEARARAYKPTRFSFNSGAGGRCTECKGNGAVRHEMSFLPDARTTCHACHGLRFEPATLDIRYLGYSIGEVLRLTARQALDVFAAHHKVAAPLGTLVDLGVGYLQLGQGSPTLSGGEAQRLKLANELSAGRGHKPTLYLLDEPTTGLHHSDVGKLIAVLDRLVQRGDSLVIIEHHPSMIAAADHIIELGPDAGALGGEVVAEGTPAEVRARSTATAAVLRNLGG